MSRTDASDGDFCAFCTLVLDQGDRPIMQDTGLVVAFEDHFPSAAGHTLVIPRRHIGRLLDLSSAEQSALWNVACSQLRRLNRGNPDAFTIGVNDGLAAGQTVAHVHLHVIPRHHGDTAEPRGGIRWVRPETAAYWTS